MLGCFRLGSPGAVSTRVIPSACQHAKAYEEIMPRQSMNP